MTSATCMFTLWWADGERDAEAGVFDDVDDVLVMHVHDVGGVDGEDAVADLQSPAPRRRALLDDATCHNPPRHTSRHHRAHTENDWA